MIFKKDILDHYRPFFISTFKICSVFMIKKKKYNPFLLRSTRLQQKRNADHIFNSGGTTLYTTPIHIYMSNSSRD